MPGQGVNLRRVQMCSYCWNSLKWIPVGQRERKSWLSDLRHPYEPAAV